MQKLYVDLRVTWNIWMWGSSVFPYKLAWLGLSCHAHLLQSFHILSFPRVWHLGRARVTLLQETVFPIFNSIDWCLVAHASCLYLSFEVRTYAFSNLVSLAWTCTIFMCLCAQSVAPGHAALWERRIREGCEGLFQGEKGWRRGGG